MLLTTIFLSTSARKESGYKILLKEVGEEKKHIIVHWQREIYRLRDGT